MSITSFVVEIFISEDAEFIKRVAGLSVSACGPFPHVVPGWYSAVAMLGGACSLVSLKLAVLTQILGWLL